MTSCHRHTKITTIYRATTEPKTAEKIFHNQDGWDRQRHGIVKIHTPRWKTHAWGGDNYNCKVSAPKCKRVQAPYQVPMACRSCTRKQATRRFDFDHRGRQRKKSKYTLKLVKTETQNPKIYRIWKKQF